MLTPSPSRPPSSGGALVQSPRHFLSAEERAALSPIAQRNVAQVLSAERRCLSLNRNYNSVAPRYLANTQDIVDDSSSVRSASKRRSFTPPSMRKYADVGSKFMLGVSPMSTSCIIRSSVSPSRSSTPTPLPPPPFRSGRAPATAREVMQRNQVLLAGVLRSSREIVSVVRQICDAPPRVSPSRALTPSPRRILTRTTPLHHKPPPPPQKESIREEEAFMEGWRSERKTRHVSPMHVPRVARLTPYFARVEEEQRVASTSPSFPSAPAPMVRWAVVKAKAPEDVTQQQQQVPRRGSETGELKSTPLIAKSESQTANSIDVTIR